MGTNKDAIKKEYITIKEYATARDVSTASVYKRLSTSLAPWLKVVNGRKVLLSSVLEDEQNDRLITNYQHKVENQPTVDNRETAEKSAIIEELRAQISQQQAENGRLQAEADAMRAAIQEKDKTIAEFAARFAELAARNAELANQAQQLHAAATMIEAKSTAGKEDGPTAEKKRGRLARFLFGE